VTIILAALPNISNATTKAEVLSQIRRAEKEYNIPSGLLLAVAKTESNLETYALNIKGRPVFPIGKEDALKIIRQALDSGISNIDIGVAQLNYKWHQHNFSSLEAMLSPEGNIKYAASLLSRLKQEHGDWHKALCYYHSSEPAHYKKYSRKVVLCWLNS
jgi:soluble lytic murein transglycosylase-like protein